MGVDIIDEQHRHQTINILEMNPHLDNYTRKGRNPAEYEWIVNRLDEIYHYAEQHFEDEERVMQKFRPSNYATHVSEHMVILDKLQEASEQVKSGQILASRRLKVLFAEWWINHINYTDHLSFSERPQD